MANHSTDQAFVQPRDGVSQAQRRQAALDPDYIAVDERSLADLLAFARQYARELHYYNLHNRAAGDWSAFLSPDLNADDVIAFLQNPDAVPPQKAQQFRQPHVVLFLTFLQLLQQAQQQMNTLTRRHLDFYYHQVLRMSKRPAVPDRVHVLVALAVGVEQALLPAGTRLQAGTDSLGQEMFYQTERDIVANRAQVARLSSLYVEKQVTGIREAHELHDVPQNEKFMNMLEMALGDPAPGDPLPPYETGETVEYPFLLSLQRLVNFARTDLFLEFFEFRDLMRRKRQRDQGDAEWTTINQLLEKAGKTRTKNDQFLLNPPDPRDFDANLATALGSAPNFAGLTEVDSIYDLYEEHNRRRGDVQHYIREYLFFTDLNDFDEMMRLKVRVIDNAWRTINGWLEKAGQRQRRDMTYTLLPVANSASPDFATNFTAALGPVDFAALGVENIDAYDVAWRRVETFFFMTAENFAVLMEVAEKANATPQEWDRVYAIMAAAYQDKVYAARRRALQQKRETNGVDAMVLFALGDTRTDPGEAAPLDRLRVFVLRAVDWQTLTAALANQEWDEVYRIVEIAQRNRENLPVPVAQQETWRNLYPFADATTVGVTRDLEPETDTSRWKTFGRIPPTVATDPPPPASLGWALCSPLLSLSAGQRTITLTLGFAPEPFDAEDMAAVLALQPFEVQLSTAKGWVTPDTVTLTAGLYRTLSGVADPTATSLKALQVTMTLSEQVDPITPLPVEAGVLPAPWPVLRLLLRQIWQPEGGAVDAGRYDTHYQSFKDLLLLRTHVQVKVTGLTAVQMENDETVLNPARPFEPFGSTPAVGSRFALGHPELVSKRLDRLDFHLEWMGVPADLGAHYQNYPAMAGKNNAGFTVSVHLVDKRLSVPLATQAPLFPAGNAAAPHTITLADVPGAIQAGRPGYVYERAPHLVPGSDLRTWDRYLQWELGPLDLQHTAYPSVATTKSIELATAIASQQAVTAAPYQVNAPYTPKIKSLSVDYSSTTEVVLAGSQSAAGLDQILHVQPFGDSAVQLEPQTTHACFLPQYDNEGELYIGCRDVSPPQNLTLLLQMAEGSADPDLEPVPVQWSYLSNNRWVSLEQGNILLDTTRGLRNTGILEVSLPVAHPNTVLAPELYWLRVAIARHSNSVCDTVSIHAQAVAAIFVDAYQTPDHLSRSLPAHTITQLLEPLPAVRAIEQPYTSSGGKMAEQDSHLYTRVSERLRHKQRALTIWDYEHLLLERFPQLYKVKCLPADLTTPPAALGGVEIVVIPDIRGKLPFNPFEPKVPADLLADMTTYLADKTPRFATVTVKNAYYVPVKVRFAVRFLPGGNEGFYKQMLNDEIVRFLSPWAYDGSADIVIGGKLYANTLIHFIEGRPYVDYVAEVKLFSSEDRRTFRLAATSPDDGYYVTTARPDGVLVTVRQHDIDMITEAGYEAATFRGINYMKIELDFAVGGN